MGLKETLQKGIVHISRGFNLYNKFQETENIASRGVSIVINNNFKKIYQNVVALNINLQTVQNFLCSIAQVLNRYRNILHMTQDNKYMKLFDARPKAIRIYGP